MELPVVWLEVVLATVALHRIHGIHKIERDPFAGRPGGLSQAEKTRQLGLFDGQSTLTHNYWHQMMTLEDA